MTDDMAGMDAYGGHSNGFNTVSNRFVIHIGISVIKMKLSQFIAIGYV